MRLQARIAGELYIRTEKKGAANFSTGRKKTDGAGRCVTRSSKKRCWPRLGNQTLPQGENRWIGCSLRTLDNEMLEDTGVAIAHREVVGTVGPQRCSLFDHVAGRFLVTVAGAKPLSWRVSVGWHSVFIYFRARRYSHV